MSEDLIEIRDLLLRGILGVNPEEREKKQDILVNLTLYVDLRPAGMTDNIADTANYRTITKHVIEHVESIKRFTIEALANDRAYALRDISLFSLARLRKAVARLLALRE
ncbi:MAG: dihydroneopterin aldolase, partial [Chloroflexi bacterium]|nr:dihydroneopterin aldolase [Chloroflexota bacterium]